MGLLLGVDDGGMELGATGIYRSWQMQPKAD